MIDWSLNINSLLMLVIAAFQLMFLIGRWTNRTDASSTVTRNDMLRLEKELSRIEREFSESKREWALSLVDMQRTMTAQHQALGSMYVGAAEFRQFVRRMESFESTLFSRLDFLRKREPSDEP